VSPGIGILLYVRLKSASPAPSRSQSSSTLFREVKPNRRRSPVSSRHPPIALADTPKCRYPLCTTLALFEHWIGLGGITEPYSILLA
jgi:hypothetical protein